jgi:preprotein translocase subunit SecA
MIVTVKSKVKERDLRQKLESSTLDASQTEWLDSWHKDKRNNGNPLPLDDARPGWRILRAEIWRQFGTLLDLEKRFDGDADELRDSCINEVAASLIQQRERLYDLSDAQMASVIEKVLSADIAEDEWDWDELEDAFSEQFNIKAEINQGTVDEVAAQVWPQIETALGKREKDLERAWLMYFLRHFYLEEIDQQWIEHLKTMDALREGIGLQGYGQKDPKKEYKKAGFSLFAEMMDRIAANTVTKVFRVQMQKQEAVPELQHEKERELAEHGAANKSEEGVSAEDAQRLANERAARKAKAKPGEPGAQVEQVRRERPKVGRNDPCPCGSGKKYKKCHGKDEEAAASE